METILRTDHLTKQFGSKAAVNQVSMTINKGDIYGFIGKNGAGKTTLMRLVLKLTFPTSGGIELFGESKLSMKNLSRTGSLIEAPTLAVNCTAWENMKRMAILYNASDSDIHEILREVSLDNTGAKKVKQFSFGMKQRLGIAIALLGGPELIVLDEPVNGLDPEGIREMRDLILRLNRERGTTFLISSHLLDELSKVVTKYGIIRDGVLVEEITAGEVMRKCTRRLKITVDDLQRARAFLAARFGDDAVTLEGASIALSGCDDRAAEVNRMLVYEGFNVSALENMTCDVESYFIDLMGGVG